MHLRYVASCGVAALSVAAALALPPPNVSSLGSHAELAAEIQLSGAITRVCFPPSQDGVPASAVSRAALALRQDGCVVLCSAPSASSLRGGQRESGGGAGLLAGQGLGLPSAAVAKEALDALLARVSDTGRDILAEFEFVEIYHRSRLRYDVSCSSTTYNTSQQTSPEVASYDLPLPHHPSIPASLSSALDSLVVPIINAAYLAPSFKGPRHHHQRLTHDTGSDSGSARAICDGVVTSRPGAPAQRFHTDGPRGLVTAFVPLVDCEETGTELWLGSHDVAMAELLAASGALGDDDSGGSGGSGGWLGRGLAALFGPPDSAFARPHLRRGDVLLFDYAIVHRGRAHPASTDTDGHGRPVLYRTFNWGGDAVGVHEGPGGLNWPLATLVEAEAAATAASSITP